MNEEGYWGESYNFEVSAAYVKTFAEKHTIDTKFVYNVAENTGWNFNAYRGEYLSTVVDQLFAGAADTQQNGGNSDEGGRMGLVGRLKYDFMNRYIVEVVSVTMDRITSLQDIVGDSSLRSGGVGHQ